MSDEEFRVPGDFKNLEEDLQSLALGIQTTINADVYIKGLDTKLGEPIKMPPRESPEFIQLMEQGRHRREEAAWYRNCMRRNIVLPYFDNIPGACFRWMEDIVEKSLREPSSAHSTSLTNEGEEEQVNEDTSIDSH